MWVRGLRHQVQPWPWIPSSDVNKDWSSKDKDKD